MTTLIEKLMVGLGIDTSEYQKGLGDAVGQTEKGSKSIIEKLSTVGGGVVLGALAAAAAGVATLGGFLYSSVNAAREAELIQSQLNAVLKSTGGVAGITADEVNSMAMALSQLTPYEDDAIVSGQNLLLTFTNIGKDVFPMATETMLDMSTALGQDMKSSAVQLGKALQDPILGVTALRRVGVNFNEEQTEMIKRMVESGDVMGAQKFILQELQTEFGGVARAAGGTLSGKLEILKNNFGNIQETIGDALLPVLGRLATMLQEALANPSVQAGISALVGGITNFVNQVITWIPMAIEWFVQLFNWFQANPGVIVGILTAVGVAVAAFVYTTVIPAAIAAIVALAPILLVMAAIAGVAYLVYEAWTNNWGGIRTTLTDFWVNTGQPIFDQVVQWLKVFIPQAIEVLKNFWSNVLLPAIKAVWSWIQTSLIPMLQNVWNWLKTVIPPALQFLAGVWQNVLLPAIRVVWDFITGSLVPLFQVLWELLSVAFRIALTALAGLWQKVLYPALLKIWSFIQEKLMPIWQELTSFFENTLQPVLQNVVNKGLNLVKKAFDGIKQAIQYVIEKVKEFIQKLQNLSLPDWLTPGSPTPFELGLLGIGKAMDDLNRMRLPALSVNLGEVGERNRRNEGSRPVVIYGGVTVGGRAGSGSVLEELMALGGSY